MRHDEEMWRAAWLFLLILLWSGAAHADGGINPKYAHPSVGLMGGFGAMIITPTVGNSTFRDDGGFAHSGRALGLRQPSLIGGQFRVGVLTRYFEIGPQVIFGGGQLGSSEGGTLGIRQLVNLSGLSWIGVGGHALAVLPLGPMTLTFGPDIGVRSFSVPVVGQTREANATQVYVEPQAGILFNTKPFTKFGSGFFLHLWAGADVVPGAAFVGGITIGGAMDHNRMVPF